MKNFIFAFIVIFYLITESFYECGFLVAAISNMLLCYFVFDCNMIVSVVTIALVGIQMALITARKNNIAHFVFMITILLLFILSDASEFTQIIVETKNLEKNVEYSKPDVLEDFLQKHHPTVVSIDKEAALSPVLIEAKSEARKKELLRKQKALEKYATK